jgi:quinol monooxygenase YgiN
MSTHPVGLQMRFHIHEDRLDEFHQLADAQVAEAGRLAPCAGRAVFASVDDPCSFFWIERWSDLDRLEGYLRSDTFRTLLGGIRVLGHLDEQALVSYLART